MNRFSYSDKRDRPLNRWRVPASSRMQALVDEAINVVQNFENWLKTQQQYDQLPPQRKPLRRARSQTEQVTFEAGIEVLICDLTHRVLSSESGRGCVFVSMDRTMQKDYVYRAPSDSSKFPVLVRRLAEPDLDIINIVEEGAKVTGKRTAITAGGWLRRRIESYEIDLNDLARCREEVIVVQKTDKHDPRNIAEGRSEWINYPKNHRKAVSYRRQLLAINDALEDADIDYSGSRVVDTTDVRLRRYFNNASFTQGGRLFGGFYQWLSKKDRRDHLTINGWQVRAADFCNMQVAIAYAKAGEHFNTVKDAYHLDQWPTAENRKGIKKLFAAMMFAKNPVRRWPMSDGEPIKSYFPPGTSVREVCEAIEAKHPAILKFFYKGYGFKFMFAESQILIGCLRKLNDEQIVALPVHDCLIVASCHIRRAHEVMVETFKEHLQGNVAVEIDGRRIALAA